MKKKEEVVVLNEQLQDEELELLKGGVHQSSDAVASDPEDQDVDRGTSHCCNGW